MVISCFSPARPGALAALLVCALAAVSNSAANTLNAVGNGRNGQLGQLFALTDDRQRVADYYASLLPPQAELAGIYLRYHPDVLQDDRAVESFARLFFAEEVAQTLRSADYQTSPFKRRAIVEEWRTRLAGIETAETLTLNLFLPAMLSTNAYDFDKQAFPVTFLLPEEAALASGVAGLTCLKLDRTFELDAFAVPESEAEAFIVQNRSSRLPGRGASIFIGLQLKITGRPQAEGATRPRCQLAAEVVAIDALEYRSREDFSETYAWPGKVLTSFFSQRSAPVPVAHATVQTTYDKRTLPADAPAEAREFNLKTRAGLILMPPKDINPGWLAESPEAREALSDYGNFIGLGIYPEAFVSARSARCMTRIYLTADDDAAYFPDRPMDQGWRGATEFEKKRTEAAFRAQALPKLQARAVHAPQRYLILGEVVLPEYDFEHNGFWLHGINATATMRLIFADCFAGLRLLPMADPLHEFWSIAPAEAETMLNSMPVERTVGTRNIRTAYLATEVELVNLVAARPRQGNSVFVEQPPLRLKIISSKLYSTADLDRVIHTPPVIHAAPSVLEAGLPDNAAYSKSYRIDYGNGSDLLQQLKTRGTFEDWEWPQLMRQQMTRDARYYLLIKPNYRPGTLSPAVLVEQDSRYTPFFPHGMEDAQSGLVDHRMTEAQKALFIAWAKQQASALP